MGLEGILKRSNFAQVAMVVENMDEVKKNWASLLGVPVPPTQPCGEYEVCKTRLYGKDAPLVNSSLCFFELLPGLQLELIEPNKEHSVWRDEMERIGEGLHHVAFNVDNADEVVKQLVEEYDAVVEQEGFYGDASGKYVYLSLHRTLKCRIELLESFR